MRDRHHLQPYCAFPYKYVFTVRVCVSVAEKRQRDGVSLCLFQWMLNLGLDCTVQVAALLAINCNTGTNIF